MIYQMHLNCKMNNKIVFSHIFGCKFSIGCIWYIQLNQSLNPDKKDNQHTQKMENERRIICTYHLLNIEYGICFSVSLATLTFDHSDSAFFSCTVNGGGQQHHYKNNLVFPALMRMASVAVVTLIDNDDPL